MSQFIKENLILICLKRIASEYMGKNVSTEMKTNPQLYLVLSIPSFSIINNVSRLNH